MQLGRQAIQECSFKHGFPLNVDSYDSLSLLYVSSHAWDPLACKAMCKYTVYQIVVCRQVKEDNQEIASMERKYVLVRN